MKQNQANEYIVRISTVCDYIETHLGEDMTLYELARIAGFSEYHFHRIFAAMTGETLFCFISRLRLERAATQLCLYHDKNVTQIASDCGFSSPAVFSRMFKKRFLCAPSVFRQRNTGQTKSNISQLLRNSGKAGLSDSGYNGNKKWRFAMDPKVNIERIEKTRVAYLRYVGPYAGDAALFEGLYERLFAWAKPRGVDTSVTYIMYHDDPAITEEQKLRMSICVPIADDITVSGEMCEMTIGGCDYAVGSFMLSADEFGEAWKYMCEWFAKSGYQPANQPGFERYTEEGCDEKGRMKVDICMPLEPMK